MMQMIRIESTNMYNIYTAKLYKPLLHKLTSNRIFLYKFHYKSPLRSIQAYMV